MNKLGKMYQIKKHYWLLFPNKEAIATVVATVASAYGVTSVATVATVASAASPAAASWSKKYNCNVSYFSPNDLVVLLEVDGEYKKLLSSSGEMGWTWFIEDFNDCFEEVNE